MSEAELPVPTDEALRFVWNSVQSKRPFFLYLAHPMPHVPLAVSQRFGDVDRPEPQARTASCESVCKRLRIRIIGLVNNQRTLNVRNRR